MNSSEGPKFPYASPVAELKEKWRELRKSERDYWRAQFASARTSKSIRSEMVTRLGVFLHHDVQLTHFRKWLTKQDTLEAAAKKIHSDCASQMAPEFEKPAGVPATGAVQWLYHQCLRDLERRALDMVLSRRLHVKADEFYYDVLCLCVLAWLEETSPRVYLN